jgi:hypothetical protein
MGAGYLGSLCSLIKIHHCASLDNECSVLFYDMDDMHILNLKIIEDIEFQRGISVKQILEKFPSLDILIMFS